MSKRIIPGMIKPLNEWVLEVAILTSPDHHRFPVYGGWTLENLHSNIRKAIMVLLRKGHPPNMSSHYPQKH